MLVESGAPVSVAQAQLGHADPGVTLGIYSHVIGDSLRRAVEKVARILDYSGLQTGAKTELIQQDGWSGRWDLNKSNRPKQRRYCPLFSSIGVKWSQNSFLKVNGIRAMAALWQKQLESAKGINDRS